MYVTLFRRVTAAITDLKEAQRQTEDMYISSEPRVVNILDTNRRVNPNAQTEE